MEKRYQIFVSSTFTDLENERREVFQTLMQLDCIPAGMELFPAVDEEQWAFIRKIIDDCDYYLLIIGGRYGSTTAEGISYTEKEFDYAVTRGVHVIAFLHGQPDDIPAGKSDLDPVARGKLKLFREKVSKDRLVKFWASPGELLGSVALSLSKAIKAYPRPGWVRGGSISNPELLAQLNELRQAKDQIQKELEEARSKLGVATVEKLASLESMFRLEGTHKTFGHSHTYKWAGEFTWNQIIGMVGPNIIVPLPEAYVNKTLANAARYDPQKTGHTALVDRECFNTVKVQLLALGYIDFSDGDWLLTPRGKQAMLQSRTVKEPDC